ncbi:MAG: nuclear transport factor 2 family protein [Frankiaceae bacterium]|nr:nuclear transport factor 2 family protein [Frankiaceae bacterium]
MSETDDVVALWRLQATYADIVTRRAWPDLNTVFRPDVTIELDTMTSDLRRFIGPDQFVDFVSAATDRFDHFEFVILNTVVEVTGADSANGRIFMSEIRREAATGDWSTAYGLYQDRYVRVDNQWWFTNRRYRSLARTGVDGGVFGVPDGLELFTR